MTLSRRLQLLEDILLMKVQKKPLKSRTHCRYRAGEFRQVDDFRSPVSPHFCATKELDVHINCSTSSVCRQIFDGKTLSLADFPKTSPIVADVITNLLQLAKSKV